MLRVFLAGAIFCVAALAVGRPQFALRDTRNIVHSPEEWNGKKAIVVFFTTTDCPLSNNEVPEMNRTRRDYEARGVAFYAVITPQGTLLYLGRIDNLVEDFNIRRQEPTKFDLREALDAVLAGKPVPHPRTKTFGCAINLAK